MKKLLLLLRAGVIAVETQAQMRQTPVARVSPESVPQRCQLSLARSMLGEIEAELVMMLHSVGETVPKMQRAAGETRPAEQKRGMLGMPATLLALRKPAYPAEQQTALCGPAQARILMVLPPLCVRNLWQAAERMTPKMDQHVD